MGPVDCIVVPNLTRGGRPFMLVENVVVARTARRQGMASRLFDALIVLAQRADCYKVQLLSRVDRADAHRFHESRGLRPAAQGYRLYLARARVDQRRLRYVNRRDAAAEGDPGR